MSTFLDDPDTSDEEQVVVTPEVVEEVEQKVAKFKSEGDAAFRAQNYDDARIAYTECINLLKQFKMAPNATLFANRSAVFLSLKKYISALYDAQQSSKIDPKNWKAYWRQGVALLGMTEKRFRSKQAIEAFQKCLECENLPDEKKSEVMSKIRFATTKLEKQDAETPMPDMSNCAPS